MNNQHNNNCGTTYIPTLEQVVKPNMEKHTQRLKAYLIFPMQL
jgi:hypothetical protein